MIEQNIQQPKQFKILLIGDDCLDVYQFGTVDRISPEAPIPVFECTHKDTKSGMAGNVAKNCRHREAPINSVESESKTGSAGSELALVVGPAN